MSPIGTPPVTSAANPMPAVQARGGATPSTHRTDPLGWHTVSPDMRSAATHVGKPTGTMGATLPRAEDERMRREAYAGVSPDRFHEIRQHDANKRSNLSTKVTKTLRSNAQDDLENDRPVTRQAREMAASSSATLSGLDAQRNHILPAAAAQTALTGMAVAVTGKDEQRAKEAADDIVAYANLLTDNSPRTHKKVADEAQRLLKRGRSASAGETARSVAKLAKLAADHPRNIDLGSGPDNMSMSNRADVMASPGGTRVRESDYRLLKDTRQAAQKYIGDQLAQASHNIPVSPGGTIQSSKRAEGAPNPSSAHTPRALAGSASGASSSSGSSNAVPSAKKAALKTTAATPASATSASGSNSSAAAVQTTGRTPRPHAKYASSAPTKPGGGQ